MVAVGPQIANDHRRDDHFLLLVLWKVLLTMDVKEGLQRGEGEERALHSLSIPHAFIYHPRHLFTLFLLHRGVHMRFHKRACTPHFSSTQFLPFLSFQDLSCFLSVTVCLKLTWSRCWSVSPSQVLKQHKTEISGQQQNRTVLQLVPKSGVFTQTELGAVRHKHYLLLHYALFIK